MTIQAQLLNETSLRSLLNDWHSTDRYEDRPTPFPGPFSAKKDLEAWLEEVRVRAENGQIHKLQWANAVISWLPRLSKEDPVVEGKGQFDGEQLKEKSEKLKQKVGGAIFREKLLWKMRAKETKLVDGRYWDWSDFERAFIEMRADDAFMHRVKNAIELAGTNARNMGLALLGPIGLLLSILLPKFEDVSGDYVVPVVQLFVYADPLRIDRFISVFNGIGSVGLDQVILALGIKTTQPEDDMGGDGLGDIGDGWAERQRVKSKL